MAPPNPDQFGTQGWVSQTLQQDSTLPQQNKHSGPYTARPPYMSHHIQQPEPYVQPYYYNNTAVPMIAELPAPPLPAPPTTTSEQQLLQDELLAHKIQQIELEEVRRRSSSLISQQQQPMQYASPDATDFHPLSQRQSTNSLRLQPTVSLRPHSQSLSSDNVPWGPASIGSAHVSSIPTIESDPMPEVVVGSRSTASVVFDDSPIPVSSEPIWSPQSLDTTAISTHLEEHRQPPYPPQWKLPPVLATFYAYSGSKTESGSDWLTPQDTFTWRTIRPTEHAYNPAAPSYTFNFTTKGGSYRDPRFSWNMISPEDSTESKKKSSKSKTVWSYELRLDRGSGMRKTEVLHHGKEKAIFTTYVHAANYDSLRFIGPDGRAYMWVSSGRISSVDGARFDVNRHALFASVGQIQDPLYGEIVADHTFWDGYVDDYEVHSDAKCDGCQATPIKGRMWKCKTCHKHDVCDTCRLTILGGGFGESMQKACVFSLVCLPDEALCIRSASVDQSLIVATLQVLKDWEMHTIRQEKKVNLAGFQASEQAVRKLDLGVMSYWKASDWDKKNISSEKRGTMVKARRIELAKDEKKTKEEPASALSNLVGAGFALGGPGYGASGSVDNAAPSVAAAKTA